MSEYYDKNNMSFGGFDDDEEEDLETTKQKLIDDFRARQHLDEDVSLECDDSGEIRIVENVAQDWREDLSASIDYMIPFPGLAQDIQQWILGTSKKRQPALAFAATLAILATAYGRNIQLDGIKGNVMLMCLADSGEGKDWPLKCCDKILEAVGLESRVNGQMASGAALIETVVSEPSMLLCIDEVGHYFAGINSKSSNQFSREIMPIMTEMYTSAGDAYRSKKSVTRGSHKILEPNLSVLGMSTERQIMEALKSSEVADGSLARFGVFFGQNNVPIAQKRQSGSTVPDNIKNSLAAIIEKYKAPYILKSHVLDPCEDFILERLAIENYFNNLAITLEPNRAMFKPFYYRCGVRVFQMSLLIDQCQSVDVLHWCKDIVKKSTDIFIKKFLHLAADNETERLVKIIERAIKESGVSGITGSDLYRKTRQVPTQMRKGLIAEMLENRTIFSKDFLIDGAKKPVTRYFWRK